MRALIPKAGTYWSDTQFFFKKKAFKHASILFTKSQILTLYEEDYTQVEILKKISVHKSTMKKKV
jgi:hypothetical protein